MSFYLKALFAFTAIMLFLHPAPVFAQAGGGGPAGIPLIEYIFARIVCVAVPLGYTALLVVLVFAGIKYLISAGEAKAVQAAHQTVTWGLLGILFLTIAWLILLLIQNFTGVKVTQFTLSSLPGVQGFTGSCWAPAPVAPEPPPSLMQTTPASNLISLPQDKPLAAVIFVRECRHLQNFIRASHVMQPLLPADPLRLLYNSPAGNPYPNYVNPNPDDPELADLFDENKDVPKEWLHNIAIDALLVIPPWFSVGYEIDVPKTVTKLPLKIAYMRDFSPVAPQYDRFIGYTSLTRGYFPPDYPDELFWHFYNLGGTSHLIKVPDDPDRLPERFKENPPQRMHHYFYRSSYGFWMVPKNRQSEVKDSPFVDVSPWGYLTSDKTVALYKRDVIPEQRIPLEYANHLPFGLTFDPEEALRLMDDTTKSKSGGWGTYSFPSIISCPEGEIWQFPVNIHGS
ncbi:hypothetical protein HYS96_01270 [Candidatus Daviesbacteria bacterium]|nr:hypothetical protein [Candidatus Daviesbacteria bacterium]